MVYLIHLIRWVLYKPITRFIKSHRTYFSHEVTRSNRRYCQLATDIQFSVDHGVTRQTSKYLASVVPRWGQFFGRGVRPEVTVVMVERAELPVLLRRHRKDRPCTLVQCLAEPPGDGKDCRETQSHVHVASCNTCTSRVNAN